ncbi:MAG: YbaK/EbsC family protein [Thiohalophilus sp.]|uniref:aminoacyl-tRNA deacylase n=1 Tax=Thiohalophilus sp. TaxID=3028392 RepID=UPI002870257B|nr:YbaK/EbsC family protein [Thiohalophilus sp.]MDR9437613.1 YbaK/EbsC family protein [Thiohalophilus sp.]
MAIARTLQTYLAHKGIAYDLLPHRHTDTSVNSANSAHIPPDRLAKSVILEDENGYVMAVIPANRHVRIGHLNRALNRRMGLATEAELSPLFSDCDPGAVPPLGDAYGIATVVDESLDECPEVFLEAGDHEDLIHLKGTAFRRLMRGSQHARIC